MSKQGILSALRGAFGSTSPASAGAVASTRLEKLADRRGEMPDPKKEEDTADPACQSEEDKKNSPGDEPASPQAAPVVEPSGAPAEDPEKEKDEETMSTNTNAPKTDSPTTAAPKSDAPGNPPASVQAETGEQMMARHKSLIAAFPGDLEFANQMFEKGADVRKAKEIKYDLMMADGTARKQAEEKLGGAGISRGGVTASPREGGGGLNRGSPAALAAQAGMKDPITGHFMPIEGAKTYADAKQAYIAAGLKPTDADRWAQINHPDLHDAEKKRLGELLAARRAKVQRN